jgi:peptidyl-prolyl cis-trans isomerase C
MQEGAISGVVETEVGFHLLWCEKVEPGRRVPLSKARPKILNVLIERRRRNCQKAWIAELRGDRGARRRA